MYDGKIINGRKIAEELLLTVKKETETLAEKNITPGLSVVIVGDDPMSHLYVKRKQETAANVGINSFVHKMPANTTTTQLKSKIIELNNDPKIHGILVQLPLPNHIDSIEIINSIDPKKDVDGFTIENIGRLITEQDGIFPCTPQGCLHLIKSVEPNIKGLNAVVVGRSNIVGRPMSNILMNENCTVTVIHLYTKNPTEIAKKADILVSATGHAGLITEEWVNKNTIVIDVGISKVNRDGKQKLVGDVDFNNVKDKVRAITPVPGGVGPMTIAYLMKNTLKALSLQLNL